MPILGSSETIGGVNVQIGADLTGLRAGNAEAKRLVTDAKRMIESDPIKLRLDTTQARQQLRQLRSEIQAEAAMFGMDMEARRRFAATGGGIAGGAGGGSGSGGAFISGGGKFRFLGKTFGAALLADAGINVAHAMMNPSKDGTSAFSAIPFFGNALDTGIGATRNLIGGGSFSSNMQIMQNEAERTQSLEREIGLAKQKRDLQRRAEAAQAALLQEYAGEMYQMGFVQHQEWAKWRQKPIYQPISQNIIYGVAANPYAGRNAPNFQARMNQERLRADNAAFGRGIDTRIGMAGAEAAGMGGLAGVIGAIAGMREELDPLGFGTKRRGMVVSAQRAELAAMEASVLGIGQSGRGATFDRFRDVGTGSGQETKKILEQIRDYLRTISEKGGLPN